MIPAHMDIALVQADLLAWFDRFVDGYRQPDGSLSAMAELKYRHTHLVTANAVAIAALEPWPESWRCCAWAAGLLHDVGRFPQLKQFKSFNDAITVNHAECSHNHIVAGGALDAWPADWRSAVLTAVRHHNARHVPEGLPEFDLAMLQVVRDADKLDIYRVFQNAILTGQVGKNPEMILGANLSNIPNANSLGHLRDRTQMAYSELTTLGDFLIMQLVWMHDLNCRGAFRLILEREILDFIASQLPAGDREIDELIAVTREHVEAKANGKLKVDS